MLLEGKPDPNLVHYLSEELGLSIPQHEILKPNDYPSLASIIAGKPSPSTQSRVEELRHHPAPWIDGFVTDRVLVEVAAALGKKTVSTLEGSQNGNNKYLLYQHQLEKELPVFETLIAYDHGELANGLAELGRKGYQKAVVKAQIGASGSGMIQLATNDLNVEGVPDFMFLEGPYMVQGRIDESMAGVRRVGSPSVQLFLNDDALFLFDLTEQILSAQSVHEGNISPPPYLSDHPDLKDELLRQAQVAGEWLFAQGYRWTASTDFIVIERDGKAETILCEINARVTGATYPAVLARHFQPHGSWCMRNISFCSPLEGQRLLSLMKRAGVLYQRGAPKGMLPFNFNTEAAGKVIKGQFLCIGEDGDECFTLLTHAWSVLPVEWGYDRD